MKKATKLLALVMAMCMIFSLTALADSFEVTVNVDGTDLVVTGEVDTNGNVTVATIGDMAFADVPQDDLTASIVAAAEEQVRAEVYDVNAARMEAFGVITADESSASGEASGGASGSSEPITYDVYIEESAAYDTYEFDGSTMGALDGYYLTVTIGGVEHDPASLNGVYEDVVFSVTEQIPAIVDGYEVAYRTALYIDENGVGEEYSVQTAVLHGEYDDESASDIFISSQGPNFEGMIFNNAEYTVDGLTMIAEGNGVNDFCGLGAGVAVGGASKVTINDYDFISNGIIRHAVFVGGDDLENPADLTVNGGVLISANPEYADGTTKYTTTSGMSMSSSPWMLGIVATPEVRTQLMASTGVVTYNDCVILSSGWGIVSSDAVDGPANWGEYTIQMNVNDSILDFTGFSGYCSYAIGATHNRFTNCIIGDAIETEAMAEAVQRIQTEYDYAIEYEPSVTAAEDGRHYNMTYALIVANETSGGTFDNVTYTGEYGVMWHKTNNVRYVPGATDNTAELYPADGYTLLKDSTFYTNGAALLVKACTPVIYVENTRFESNTGVIVQLATCDDPGMGHQYFSEALDTSVPVEADPDYDPYDYNTKNQTIFSYNVENMVNDVQVEFADCTGETALNGDFYNSISVSTTGEGMTWWGQNLILSFDNCEINGYITSSTALHNAYSGYYDAEGNEIVADTLEEALAAGAVEGRITSANATYLGNMSNTPSAPVNNGVWAILKNGTTWNVPGTCYLTVLEVEEGCTVNGTVTVDGVETDVSGGGRWTGNIVVEDAVEVVNIDGEDYITVDDLLAMFG